MKEYIYDFLENIEYQKILVNICVGVGMMSLFLTIFYFYYVLVIEHDIVKDNINILAIDLMSSIKPFLSLYAIKSMIKKIKNPDMKKEDEHVESSNNLIKMEAIKIMTIICVIFISIGYGLSIYFNIDFYKIIVNNLLILVILGITEYSFLHILPAKIITGDPNFIKYKVLVNVKNKIKFE